MAHGMTLTGKANLRAEARKKSKDVPHPQSIIKGCACDVGGCVVHDVHPAALGQLLQAQHIAALVDGANIVHSCSPEVLDAQQLHRRPRIRHRTIAPGDDPDYRCGDFRCTMYANQQRHQGHRIAYLP